MLHKEIMKKILIAATAVGTAIAGLILYARKRNQNRLAGRTGVQAALPDGAAVVERSALHTMG
jgi:hypothetical protein